MSDKDNVLTYAVNSNDILDASNIIKNELVRTKCQFSKNFSEYFNFDVYLKNEGQQITNSYKSRGALNTLAKLSEEQKKIGVICASAGNHALAVCHFAMKMKIPVTVCMPLLCSRVKYLACVKTGADVRLHGNTFGEAKLLAEQLVQEKGYKYINGYDDPNIIAGQGTIGVEILEDVPDVDTIIVPVGGGGLIAGIATYVKQKNPNIKIIGVQTDLCNGMIASIKNNKPVTVNIDFSKTIAEGLGVSLVGSNSYQIIKSKVNCVQEISEDIVAFAALKIFELEKLIVEGASAASIGLAFSKHLEGSKKVVFVLTGSNIDPATYAKLINRGLSTDGKFIRFSLTIPSKGNNIYDVVSILHSNRANIRQLNITSDLSSDKILVNKMDCELELDDSNTWMKIKEELLKFPDCTWINGISPIVNSKICSSNLRNITF